MGKKPDFFLAGIGPFRKKPGFSPTYFFVLYTVVNDKKFVIPSSDGERPSKGGTAKFPDLTRSE